MTKRIIYVLTILVFGFIACKSQNKSNSETQKTESIVNEITDNMKSYISIFEIPATDISRAVKFYQAILDINIEIMDMEGMQMGLLPFEGQNVIGTIMKGEGYIPSPNGITIYLNGGDNLQVILNKVENNGGKIITPKTLHGDESGYFAIFLDTEGNRIGLHSPN
ncbi:MAG: glyoxalase [Fluviicola sp.]|nr:MAG: glyoxalase [Fluviicola sp.]